MLKIFRDAYIQKEEIYKQQRNIFMGGEQKFEQEENVRDKMKSYKIFENYKLDDDKPVCIHKDQIDLSNNKAIKQC